MKVRILDLVHRNKEKALVLADQGLVSGINFLVGIMLARYLGVELFGLFSLAWMTLFFASGIQQSFLTAPLFALTAKKKNKPKWFSQLLGIQVFVSAVSFVMIVLIAEIVCYYQPEWYFPNINFTLGLLVAIFLFNDFYRRILFIQHLAKLVLTLDLLSYALQPIFLTSLYYFNTLTLFSALGSILLSQVLSCIYLLLIIRPKFRWKGFANISKELWQYSRFLVATSLLQWSSANYIILYAANVLGPTAIGAIRVSQNLMGVLNVLFQAMENIIPAKSAEAYHHEGLAGLKTYMQNISFQLVVPVCLFLGGIALFHQQIMTTIYGVEYLPYSFILLAFCGIYVFVFIGTLLRFVIRTLEYNQLIFFSYILTTVFSFLVGKVLATNYGLTGVMIGIAGTQLISLISFITFFKFKIKWKFKLSTSS